MSVSSKILNAKWYRKVRTTPSLGRFMLRIIPDLPWRVTIAPLGKFAIRLRQHRMFWLREPLRGEGFMVGAIERMLRPTDVVYDIGANIGLYSRIFSQQFHARSIYSFEPMPGNRVFLMKNIKIGGCGDKVVVMPFAVGDEDGTVEFQIDDLTSNSGTLDAVTHGGASQSRMQYGLPPKTTPVQVVRLDTLMAEQKIPLPGFIKIDVEGAEALVLRGGRNLLLEHRPTLLIELHGAKFAIDVLRTLWEYNYPCYGYVLYLDGHQEYKKITELDLPVITEEFTVHFLLASDREDELARPIEAPAWMNLTPDSQFV